MTNAYCASPSSPLNNLVAHEETDRLVNAIDALGTAVHFGAETVAKALKADADLAILELLAELADQTRDLLEHLPPASAPDALLEVLERVGQVLQEVDESETT